MELKDLVLSTLAELDEKVVSSDISTEVGLEEGDRLKDKKTLKVVSPSSDEIKFLSHMRERLLVLFEGLSELEDDMLDSKLNLTLKYLEYSLAHIDDRIEKYS